MNYKEALRFAFFSEWSRSPLVSIPSVLVAPIEGESLEEIDKSLHEAARELGITITTIKVHNIITEKNEFVKDGVLAWRE